MSSHYTYILINHSRMFYVGMTDNIHRRTFDHKTAFFVDSFTDRYRMHSLIYYEEGIDAVAALARERQLKGWSRKKKIAIIERHNPQWCDLSDKWYTTAELESGVLGELQVQSSTSGFPLLERTSPCTS